MDNPASPVRMDKPILDQRVLWSLYLLLSALQASVGDADVIQFTGKWAHLGKTTVWHILDDAHTVIGEMIKSPILANIDAFPASHEVADVG